MQTWMQIPAWFRAQMLAIGKLPLTEFGPNVDYEAVLDTMPEYHRKCWRIALANYSEWLSETKDSDAPVIGFFKAQVPRLGLNWLPPGAPQTFEATNGASAPDIDLYWLPPEAHTGGDVTGYKIFRSLSGAESYSQIGTTGSGTLTYTDSTGDPSTEYDYKVVAYNAIGNGADSNVETITTDALPTGGPIEDSFAVSLATIFGSTPAPTSNGNAWTDPYELAGLVPSGSLATNVSAGAVSAPAGAASNNAYSNRIDLEATEQIVTFLATMSSSGGALSAAVRLDPTTQDGYEFYMATNAIYIWRLDGGTPTSVASYTAGTNAYVGRQYEITLTAIGTTIQASITCATNPALNKTITATSQTNHSDHTYVGCGVRKATAGGPTGENFAAEEYIP